MNAPECESAGRGSFSDCAETRNRGISRTSRSPRIISKRGEHCLQPASYGFDPSGFVAVGDAFAASADNVTGAGGQGDGKGLTPTTTFCENPPTETLK
jgi:hypothetical protein